MSSQEEDIPPIPDSVNVRNKRKTTASASDLPPKPKKVYPKRAGCWDHFIQHPDNSSKSNCIHCGQEIGCDSKLAGTIPMNSHLLRCNLYKNSDAREKQRLLAGDNARNMKVVKYDPDLFRAAVNKLVVVNELPFSFAESEGWKHFCFDVLPMYKTFSRRTCTKDIAGMYLKEKAALKELFVVQKQSVSLTTDIWVAPTTSYNYMVVTAHWIDAEWKLQKRILSFKVITDHKGDTIAGQLLDCIEEWGIEKVFTITVDNAKGNDKALRVFKDHLRMLGPQSLVLDGEFFHMRCCAHILNLIVRDGLKKAKPSIVAIRNAFKYVRSHFNRLKAFQLRCESSKITRGSLPLDCVTRWNSTYLMLTAAIKLRSGFEKMLSEDKLYCDYFLEDDEKTKLKRVGPPSSENWDEVQRLVKFLKIFYQCTLTFSASQSVSANHCYNEIVNIERNLIAKCTNSDSKVRAEAHLMRDKFEKYWDGFGSMNQLVIVATVLDPRNKLQFPALCFDQLYGKGTIESRQLYSSLISVMKRLYDQYSIRLSKPCETHVAVESEEPSVVLEMSDSDDDGCERMDSIYNKMVSLRSNEAISSELDIYLAEKTVTRSDNNLGFDQDVLSWWKSNSSKFPILSEMARDILAIQVSSVASESAFSTSGRILDPYRSSLTPYMVEVLLCTQQWLRCGYQTQAETANLVQMLAEVEFLDSLDSRNSMPYPQ